MDGLGMVVDWMDGRMDELGIDSFLLFFSSVVFFNIYSLWQYELLVVFCLTLFLCFVPFCLDLKFFMVKYSKLMHWVVVFFRFAVVTLNFPLLFMFRILSYCFLCLDLFNAFAVFRINTPTQVLSLHSVWIRLLFSCHGCLFYNKLS